jgi:hypothetical protein
VPAEKKLPPKARAFLAAYRESGSITKAAEAAKISRRLHYYWSKDSPQAPQYLAAFERAETEAGDIFEDEAKRRGVEGVLEPVFYKGKPCGAIRRHSDFLLAMILRRFKPEYREKQPVDGSSTVPPLIIDVRAEPDQPDAPADSGVCESETVSGSGGGQEVREDVSGDR